MNQLGIRKNQITEGKIWKQLLFFCFPIILGTLFQQLYNAVDVIVVGQFVGTEALASVGGSSSQIINLEVNFFVGISSGATVVVSRFSGAEDKESLNRAIHTSVGIAVIAGVFLSFIGICFTSQMLEFMQTPKEILADSILYLRIYFSGILFVLLYNIGSSILRAMGDSKRPLYYLIVCSIVNVILDLVLVIVFHMGVSGVAIATVTAQIISACLVMKALMHLDASYYFNFTKMHFYKETCSSIIYIGLPTGIQSFMNSISSIIMASAINMLGTNAVAGNTAYAKLDGIFWMISGAFSVAIATFVGQNYGAKKYKRMKQSIWVCLGMDILLSAGLSFLFLALGPVLLYLFTSDEMVIEQGMEVMKAIAPYYVIVAFYEVLTSALRGMTDVIVPMVMNIVGLCVVRIVWVLVAVPHFSDLYHIILSCPISWIITSVMILIYFTYRYKKIDLTEEL